MSTQNTETQAVQDLKDIVAKLVTDGKQYITDATASLIKAINNQTDPNTAQTLTDVVNNLKGLDTAFTDADTALNTPPVATDPAPTPDPTAAP